MERDHLVVAAVLAVQALMFLGVLLGLLSVQRLLGVLTKEMEALRRSHIAHSESLSRWIASLSEKIATTGATSDVTMREVLEQSRRIDKARLRLAELSGQLSAMSAKIGVGARIIYKDAEIHGRAAEPSKPEQQAGDDSRPGQLWPRP
jgi:hypothetical protein